MPGALSARRCARRTASCGALRRYLGGTSRIPKRNADEALPRGRESTKSNLKALRHAGRESRNEAHGEARGEASDKLGNDPIDALPIVLDGSRRSSLIHRNRAEFDPLKFASKLSAHRFRRGSSAYRESLPKGVRVDCKKLPSSVEGFGVGPDCPTAKRNIRPDGDSCKRRFSVAAELKATVGILKADRADRQMLLQIFLGCAIRATPRRRARASLVRATEDPFVGRYG